MNQPNPMNHATVEQLAAGEKSTGCLKMHNHAKS
jgi:hypothetical protein